MESDCRIIITDDSREDYELMKIALADADYKGEITWLKDGEDAINYFTRAKDYAELEDEESQFLILLDLNMPKKNGHEVLEILKADDNLKKIPVIVFSTSQSEMDAEKAYALGANNFIVKPFDFESMDKLFAKLTDYWINLSCIPKVTIKK